MSDAPAPRQNRFRRTLGLLAALALVALVTPIITVVLSVSDFLTPAARLVAPWSSGSNDVASASASAALPVTDPAVAAEALRRIVNDQSTGDNITMRTADAVTLPERDSVPAGIFVEARDSASDRGGLDGPKTLRAARRRLSPAEREYLAGIAQNPFWQQWDLLSRAQSLDFLGSRIELPFREHATPIELPLMRLRTLADAGRLTGARAAHFVAAGRRDSAEAAIHATLAVGLLFDREATNIFEAFMGRRLIYQATTLSNSLRGDTTASLEALRLARDSSVATEDEARALLVSIASDSTAHRAARFEALINLGMVPCTNVRELLFGFRGDVEAAFASARRNLIRHPSDSALLDLLETSAERSPDLHESGAFAAAFRGMSHFSSAVLFNKRIHGCAEMLPYLRMM